MDEIKKMLENWRNLALTNKVFEKDYYIENGCVYLMIAVSVEEGFLFKTFTAKCSLDEQEIEDAILKLDEKKDELI